MWSRGKETRGIYYLPPLFHQPRPRVLNLEDGDVSDSGLERISKTKSLQSLNLSKCCRITDISALSSLPTPEELNISRSVIIKGGWEALGKLTRLRVTIISLSDVANEGIRLLSGCKYLRNLELYCCKDVSNIEAINNINSLEELKVGMLPRIRILALRHVELSFFSLSSLGENKSLVKLTIERSKELCDIKLISNIATLKELKVAYSDRLLNDVGDLRKLSWLNVLRLRYFKVGNSCFESVCTMRSLKSLNLASSWKLTDISHISNLTALEELNLSGCCPITSGWEALSELPRLRVLNLESASVTTRYDGYYISRCKSLVTLNLESCYMTDASYIANIKTLEELHIGRCKELRWGFSPLFTLPRLRILNLICSFITDEDLREIQPPHTIEELNLSYCEELNDITPLGRIKSINNLHFSQIHDVRRFREGFRSLLELPCLSWVDLNNVCGWSDVYVELRKKRVHIR
ncbi:paraflagellar rod component [Trypanosoma brucei equiperdum]|uniref:Paraflagellar rod component n=1 Tax=Trypanosoma brucei equiperdum TaxID=630700 RepID=A0A3L6KXI8_9TRYP|nr:paraflagellar rod component [Trypanosoma brucei equiperdum]